MTHALGLFGLPRMETGWKATDTAAPDMSSAMAYLASALGSQPTSDDFCRRILPLKCVERRLSGQSRQLNGNSGSQLWVTAATVPHLPAGLLALAEGRLPLVVLRPYRLQSTPHCSVEAYPQ